MRWVAAALFLVAALLQPAVAHANSPQVYLRSLSPLVTQANLDDATPVFQQAVDEDFAPYWAADPQLTTTDPHPGDWTITITNAAAPCSLWGCVLGFHAVGRNGAPYAVVYAAESVADGVSWQYVATHELFEMLADPWADRAVRAKAKFWIVEVCDPVADYSYSRTSPTGQPVTVADFVTPRWFMPGLRGPYDLMGLVHRPMQVAKGGYLSYWDDLLNGWATVSADRTTTNRRTP